ncbi:MAG: HEAT repeat domain-containing protein [Firmicutes bacterium]|nr:HEAT repeat domain-containing protein [Bacillota bacterium]
MDKPELLKCLESDDYIVQKKAIRKLGGYNEPAVVDRLVGLFLKNKNKLVEEVLMETFKKMGGSYLISTFLKLLGHEDASIRSFAFELLAEIGNEDIGLIIKEINNPDKNIRKFIVDILGEIEAESAVEPLVSMLEDEDVNVVQGAVEALGKIGDDRAAEKLVEILAVSHPWVQYTILDVLGRIGNENTFSNILKMPWETETGIYGSIFKLLKQKGSGSHIKDLIGLYERIGVKLQLELLDALLGMVKLPEQAVDELKDSSIIRDLKKLLISGSRGLKGELVKYLSAVGDPAAVEILSRLLFDDDEVISAVKGAVTYDEDDEYSINLFRCLKFIESSKIKEVLADGLKSGSEPYVTASLEILKSKPIYELYPLIVGVIKEGCSRVEAVKTLSGWPVERLNMDEIYQVYETSDGELKYWVLTEILKNSPDDPKLVTAIGQLLRSAALEDDKLLKVIEMASAAGDESLIPFLQQLYDVPNMDISIAAIEAAETLRGKKRTC